MSTIGRDLDRLARNICDSLLSDHSKIPFGEKLDAFKALTAYHLGLQKMTRKDNGEDRDPTVPSLATIRQRIESNDLDFNVRHPVEWEHPEQ